MLALRLCILHAAAYSGANNAQFQLGEYCTHLDKCLAHGINLARAVVQRDAAYDDQSQAFAFDDLDDLTKLLCAAAQTTYLIRKSGHKMDLVGSRGVYAEKYSIWLLEKEMVETQMNEKTI